MDNHTSDHPPDQDTSYLGDWFQKVITTDTVDPPDLARCNGFGAITNAVHQVHLTDGPEAANKAIEAFLKNTPGLAELLANPQQEKYLYHAEELHLLPRPDYLPGAEPLYRNGINELIGDSGVGKTFLALYWALIVAQFGLVIYIAAEGAGGLQDRVAAWKIPNQKGSGALYFLPQEVDMLDSLSVEAFVERIKQSRT